MKQIDILGSVSVQSRVRGLCLKTYGCDKLCGDEPCYATSKRERKICVAAYTEQEKFSTLQELHYFMLASFLVWICFATTDLLLIAESRLRDDVEESNFMQKTYQKIANKSGFGAKH